MLPDRRMPFADRNFTSFARGFAIAIAAWSAGWLPADDVSANDSVKPAETVALGMSAAFSGPTKDLGLSMRAGIQAAIEEANQATSAPSRRYKLVALDDGYEPTNTAPNMRRLIEQEHVVAVIGNVGTPTAVAAVPISNELKTPFVGAFTGAGVLRKNPPDRYVINFRASYAEETAAMVDALVTYAGVGPAEIGFFAQRDAFGDAGVTGGLAALKRHGLSDVTHVPQGRYERNTTNVDDAVADLLLAKTPVRAVIMVGTSAPCAEFIKVAHRSGMSPLFLNVSFVGASKLAKDLGSEGEGVIVTQVVPHIGSNLPLVQQYRRSLAALPDAREPDFVSLEGYIAARMLLRAVQGIDGPVTREAIVESLERLGNFQLGFGESLRLSHEEHQACHSVWPTMLSAGKVVPIDWSQLKAHH